MQSKLGQRLNDAGLDYDSTGDLTPGELKISREGEVLFTGSAAEIASWLDTLDLRLRILELVDEIADARFNEGFAAKANPEGLHRLHNRAMARAFFEQLAELLPPGIPGEGT